MPKRYAVILLFVIALAGGCAWGGEIVQGENAMKQGQGRAVRLIFPGGEIRATVHPTPTGDDFLALLPLTLTFRDYAGAEKIADPPRRLTTRGAPSASTPVAGDLAYYAPWGNLAFFYRDGGHSPGLIIVGAMTSGVEQMAALRSDFVMTIEAAE